MIPRNKSTSDRLSKFFKKKSDSAQVIPPPPGDIPAPRAKDEKVTPEQLRDLRNLICYRYALDIEIWQLRDVQEYDRDIVREKMRKARAALRKIILTVESLDDRSYFSSEAEYSRFQQIKLRVMEGGKRDWEKHPPWEEDEQVVNAPMPMYVYTSGIGEVVMSPYELDSTSSRGTMSFVSSASVAS